MTASAELDGGPVTLVISRRVRPGGEADFEAWARELQQASRGFPGYLGVGVLRPAPGEREYTFVMRFASSVAARAWDEELRREWLPRAPAAALEADAQVRVEGVEFWFSAPGPAAGSSAGAQPVRWKMALVLSFVVAGLIMALTPLTRRLVGWPLPLRALLIGAIQCFLMTYLVMPRVTHWLWRWVRPRP